jgi:hypothetical protein
VIDKNELKNYLLKLLDEADEVQAASGETPSAQEAIEQIIDWVDQSSIESSPPLVIPPA